MTPQELQTHVLCYSCRQCVHFREGKGNEQRCVSAFDKCKSGKPLGAVPSLFKRRVK